MPRSLALAAVGALAVGSAAAMSNAPGAPGPHSTKSFTTGDNLVVMPADLADGQRAPGVVFDHGLCGAVPLYEPLLEHLASYGMVVIANRAQEACVTINMRKAVNNPFAFAAKEAARAMPNVLGQALHDPVGFARNAVQGMTSDPAAYALHEMEATVPDAHNSQAALNKATDTRAMTRHTEANFEWLREQPYVDAENIAFMGHSMGGGDVITTAGLLAQAGKPGPKAVVAIAPWNGTPSKDGTRPADVVGSIEEPILMFCSPTDLVVPCNGPAFTLGVPSTVTRVARKTMPITIGAGASIDEQAMMPIFDNAKNAVLLEAKDLTHLGLAHIDNVGQERNELDAAFPFLEQAVHVDLLHRSRPYGEVPTAHYAVPFLLDVFSGNNSTAAELGAVVAEADRDGRFVSVLEKGGGPSAAGTDSTPAPHSASHAHVALEDEELPLADLLPAGNRRLLFGRE